MCLCLDDFREQLIEDSAFLKADWRLDTELVDKLILQLNRIYPQILTDKEATKVSLQDRTHQTKIIVPPKPLPNICFLTLNIFAYLLLTFSFETWMYPQVFGWESFLHICKAKEKRPARSFTELCICMLRKFTTACPQGSVSEVCPPELFQLCLFWYSSIHHMLNNPWWNPNPRCFCPLSKWLRST